MWRDGLVWFGLVGEMFLFGRYCIGIEETFIIDSFRLI